MIVTLAEIVKEGLDVYPCRLSEITCAASLAHHRLLGSVNVMRLHDVDLTSVPAEHLASLASCVTMRVAIRNVSGCGLVTILDSVNCAQLVITDQSLGCEETQALLWAMESGVKKVVLGGHRYREQLRTWATSRNWKVTPGFEGFSIKRM